MQVSGEALYGNGRAQPGVCCKVSSPHSSSALGIQAGDHFKLLFKAASLVWYKKCKMSGLMREDGGSADRLIKTLFCSLVEYPLRPLL